MSDTPSSIESIVLTKIDKLADKVGDLVTQLTGDAALHKETKKDIDRLESGLERAGQRLEALEKANHAQDLVLVKLQGSAARFNMMDNKATTFFVGVILAGAVGAWAVFK